MKEYIEREEVALKVKRNLMPNVDVDGTVSVENAERYFLNLLAEQPAADVVEVVRCKDCLFGHRDYDYEYGYTCVKPLYHPGVGEMPHRKLMQDCDYCSHGLRRED